MAKHGKPPANGFKKGKSGNPNGAPRRGESWAEIIKRVGNMTPSEAAEQSLVLAKQLIKYGDGLTLKEAVVLRVYGALLFEPNAGLLNAFMNRAEGMPNQPVTVEPSQALLRRMDELGITLDDVRSDPLAVSLFSAAGISVDVGGETNRTTGEAQDNA